MSTLSPGLVVPIDISKTSRIIQGVKDRSPIGSRLKSPPDRTEVLISLDSPIYPTKPPPAPINKDATDINQEIKIKADYRVKLGILREAYPNMSIPDFPDTYTIPQVIDMYKAYVKRIQIDSSVETNNTYLVILWLIIETVGTRVFKLPMTDYFRNQFKYMKKYQMLLIELGEKSFSTGLTDGWPVEVRLLAMAIFNAVIFVLVKILADKISLDSNYTDRITQMVDDFLTKGSSDKKEALKMAEEATTDFIPPKPAEQPDPLGGFGGIISNVLSMIGGNNSSSTESNAPQPAKKKVQSFGNRTKDKKT